MMEDLMSRTGLKINTNHGLRSWAARHACWTLNKYQASRGITSFELVHGKPYDGSSLSVPVLCLQQAPNRAKEILSGD